MLWIGCTVASALLVSGFSTAHRELRPVLDHWLRVHEVAVRGLHEVSRQEVLERLGLARDATLLSVQTDALAAKLRSHPWIKEARVHRRPPHTLEIQIEERRPAAVLSTTTVSLLVDEDGRILGLADPRRQADLPAVRGVDPNGLLQGNSAVRAAAQSGVRLGHMLKMTAAGSLMADGSSAEAVEIDVSQPENVVASVNGVQFQFGGSGFEEKWSRYQLVEPDLSLPVSAVPGRHAGRVGGRVAEIDLRYDGKVIVRERG